MNHDSDSHRRWWKRLRVVVILAILFDATALAQHYADFQSLLYPHSVIAGGLGEQGVALRNSVAAMQYNPANLVFSDGVGLSYFRNPWNLLGVPGGLPLSSAIVTGKVGELGTIGLEYSYWDWGELTYSTVDNPDGGGTQFHSYQQSFAVGFASPLNDRLALGGQIRYARMPRPPSSAIEHLLFSAGATYMPELLSDRITVGLSLMNFGTRIDYGSFIDTINGQAVKYSQFSPPPAQLNIGLAGKVVSNEFFDVEMTLGATKPFADIGGPPSYEAASSFNSLFTNWKDFPGDVTGQIGLGYAWHPIELTPGISYVQELYLGYYSVGAKVLYESFYTHGVKVGLDVYGIRATAGYAGRWHNNNAGSYLLWEYPWETFQFTLSADDRIFGTPDGPNREGQPLHGIVLSGGYTYGVELGRMKESPLGDVGKVTFEMRDAWSVQSEFVIDDQSSLVAELNYARMIERMEANITFLPMLPPVPFKVELGIDVWSLQSGFRYHPLNSFEPLFVQLSLGIARMKAVNLVTTPRYNYKTFDELAAGCVIPILESGIVVVPSIGLRTFFMEDNGASSRLLGYNQVGFGVHAGYQL